METGKRSSFDEISIAALRRFTRTPTNHRLSLRRSTSGSTSSASIKSFESDRQPPCVYETTRDTPSDECALHRFIVWAAVKRNVCPKMTAEERRECPLLRCRKRFPNHELLLQHLYGCEHLESGEYWCYDCGKVETFHEMNKCRRCLGHPSKRKKLMSLAKSVFSNLGRPKAASLPPLELEIEESPPSYDYSVHGQAVQQFELQSNEIHEIDSSEVTLATIPEDREALEHDFLSRSSSTSSTYTRPLSVCSRQSMGGSQEPVNYESYIKWSPSPPVKTISPADLVKPTPVNPTVKPALQLNTTTALDFYRARSRRRSKNLQPSSSVRSTSSTTSTNSTNSTSSTASCTISPMSAWSDAWANGTGFESTLTSPADDVPNPDDVLPCSQPLPPHPEVDEMNLAFAQFGDGPSGMVGLSELPADVPTYLCPVPAEQPNILSATTVEIIPSPTETLRLGDPSNTTEQSHQLMEELKSRDSQQASPHTLMYSARDTLDLHVSASLEKLEQLNRSGNNHVAAQFCSMEANSVSLIGFETMSDLLQGKQVQSPGQLLSFLHVVYSLSLVIHEQDATNWWAELFMQAVSYSSGMSQEDRHAYLQVVDFLWKPGDLTDEEFMEILQQCLSQPSTSAWKGKQPAGSIGSNDPLLFISQYFLDELEYATIRNTTKPEIQTSNLCAQHLKDTSLVMAPNSSFGEVANCLILSLSHQYHNVVGFVTRMKHLLDKVFSNHVSTVRRLELELLQSGKMQLPSEVYFDTYVQQVRTQIDSLQNRVGLQYPLRLQYYKLGIELAASIMHGNDGLALGGNIDEPGPAASSLDIPELHVPMSIDFSFDDFVPFEVGLPAVEESLETAQSTTSTEQEQHHWPPATPRVSTTLSPSKPATPLTPAKSEETMVSTKMNSEMCCDICGYRPKGDPKWFHGSMAKHKKLQHGTNPPKIYQCPFPGCNSQYKKRPDNLRQHQIEKGHFVDGQDGCSKGRKRRKLE